MKPLRARLEDARKRTQLPWEVIERDYLLSCVLAAVSRVDSLRETLVFKGGTALKKCYFGDYRFSEDLDFSIQGTPPTGAAMDSAMRRLCEATSVIINEYAHVSLNCERYTEKEPHPGGQEAFSIRAKLPWHKQFQTRVVIETTVDERLLLPVSRRKIIHDYGEPIDADVLVYSLEEIVAEKLRAILQHIEKLEHRGWGRSRARDYYDLWRILTRFKTTMRLSSFDSLLREKCSVRGVSFTTSDDFFQTRMMEYVEKTWFQWLGPLVPNLVSFQTVIDQLRPEISELLRH